MSRINRYEYKEWKSFGSRVKRFREQIQNIINRCDEEELAVLKHIIVATFPNIDKIDKKRKLQAEKQ